MLACFALQVEWSRSVAKRAAKPMPEPKKKKARPEEPEREPGADSEPVNPEPAKTELEKKMPISAALLEAKPKTLAKAGT